ncbi:hypothetical protein AWB85_06665 [Mycobacteroides immunogenum]|uniref:Uncharacterized protein n=1 Tax=Mycobacteroides immunogenum TaxID=83262 RepID=A0A179VG98_9MYCO|nr:hypothetical protein [Mycobacteroides immunogenum]OAT70948.1 hypothetical protein AWB85_06665 [Mycobacteroides immunogenum]
MSDPAVEAAQRVWAAMFPLGPSWSAVAHDGNEDFFVAAAREMAKSVQELIAEARTWKHYPTRDIGSAYCADTVDDFLDELAKRVYTTEELER